MKSVHDKLAPVVLAGILAAGPIRPKLLHASFPEVAQQLSVTQSGVLQESLLGQLLGDADTDSFLKEYKKQKTSKPKYVDASSSVQTGSGDAFSLKNLGITREDLGLPPLSESPTPVAEPAPAPSPATAPT
eukprot:CAMPEP_0119332676 /NCGR_PEP_ID=MMETSP1333-20130426/83279_1 /TAXON_ID=418940 /ORGANISM="Scyphosphaera apsteinii, Strain RCC1455" /LENGTH=130 /DNA_ID=CAMNT_0007342553 /DNA_START=32 /DNA_END=420 /DNA_ORIENTATION=+